MPNGIREIYQTVFLDHYRHPRCGVTFSPEESYSEELNALCGDRVRLAASRDGERWVNWRHQTQGCAICIASASILCEVCEGCSRDRVYALYEGVHSLLRDGSVEGAVEALQAFQSLHPFPMRHRCALLSWEAALQEIA